MATYPRFTLNRSLIVLLPRQPMVDWINLVDPNPSGISIEEVRHEQNGFLVSSDKVETTEDAQRWVNKNWQMLFEHQLNEWYTAESMWPANRSLKMFKEWFEIRYHPMLWDLGNDVLELEDWDQ